MGLFLLALLAQIALAKAPAPLEMPVPAGKTAKLRVYQEMLDGKVRRQVLVGAHLIPEGSRVRVDLAGPLLYRWILNNENKIIQSSMPYFPVKVLSLTGEFDPREREAILQGEFLVHIRDLDDARIVAGIYRDSLPEGVEKIPHPFPWDAFNPQGTWSHSVVRGLKVRANAFLVQAPPRDVADFCPRYESLGSLQREIFWVALVNLIARFESAYIPLTASDEGRYSEGSKGIISSGLTQISLASTRASCYQARGCSAVRNQDDLFNPDRGLRCSVGIMSCLAESGGCLSCKKGNSWYGIARYWSTLRDPYDVKCPTCPGGKVTVGKKPYIQELLKTAAAFCF